MRARLSLIIALAILTVSLSQSVSQAGAIHKFNFNVMTTNYPGQPLQIGFYFEIADTAARPPDAIADLQIQAPDGTVFYCKDDFYKYWEEWSQDFFIYKITSDFNSQAIPAGTYNAMVKDNAGNILVNSDTLPDTANTPLPITNITNPPHTDSYNTAPTIGGLRPTLVWSPVSGATHYRIFLNDETKKEMVYGVSRVAGQVLFVYTNTFVIPKGVLWPNHTYSLRIEARDDDKNVSRRSRTAWAYFKTP